MEADFCIDFQHLEADFCLQAAMEAYFGQEGDQLMADLCPEAEFCVY